MSRPHDDMPAAAPRLSVKGVLCRTRNAELEVLLLRNEREEWELPGGKMEGGETPETCLAREFLEETGLQVAVGPCVAQGVLSISPPHVPSPKQVSMAAYGCNFLLTSHDDEVLLSREHQGWQWVSVADLKAMPDLPDVYKLFIFAWAQLGW